MKLSVLEHAQISVGRPELQWKGSDGSCSVGRRKKKERLAATLMLHLQLTGMYARMGACTSSEPRQPSALVMVRLGRSQIRKREEAVGLGSWHGIARRQLLTSVAFR